MPDRARFGVLVATDGSRHAQTAVAASVEFPWPKSASGHGVLARARLPRRGWPQSVTRVLEQSELRAAFVARRVLRRRWPDAEVAVVDRPPVDGILAEARRLDAGVVVVGARGHGALSRLVLGSVSLGVVRGAPGPVLVVKRPLRVARLIIGVDGSAHSRRAVELVTGLAVPDKGAVALVAILEPLRPVSAGLLPSSLRATLSATSKAPARPWSTPGRRASASSRSRPITTRSSGRTGTTRTPGRPSSRPSTPSSSCGARGSTPGAGSRAPTATCPTKREGAIKVSDHHVRSPLLNIAGPARRATDTRSRRSWPAPRPSRTEPSGSWASRRMPSWR